MIIHLKVWFLFFVASGLLMLCCACFACLISRVKKKDFFSFSEKCGWWYNLSPFVVNVVKRNCLTLDCSRVSVCTPMCLCVCAHGCPFARGQLRSQRGLGWVRNAAEKGGNHALFSMMDLFNHQSTMTCHRHDRRRGR